MGSNGLKETKWAQSGTIGINGPITCKKRSIMGPNGLKEAKWAQSGLIGINGPITSRNDL